MASATSPNTGDHTTANTHVAEIRHFHLFCGLGGGAAGFNRGEARVGRTRAAFRCIGGIDVDPASIRDFGRLAGVPGTVLDLFNREQYRAFHGREPGPDWREASITDIHRAAGGERPHIVFLSAPCKGFSGLLAEKQSGTAKYQALNGLTLRGVWLMLEAWADDPPELVVFENVPRIMTRGRKLLDAIVALLRSFGYATAETTHDCGKLGGLAQSRKRFLLVARHRAKVPPFLYAPMNLPLRGVGEVIGLLPLPGDIATAGPMHRVPELQWRTWVRLAFVDAGKDWRSLSQLRVGDDGNLLDFGVAPEWRGGVLGVNRWNEPIGVIPGRSSPTNGALSVADPRIEQDWPSGQLGVRDWGAPAPTVTGQRSPYQGGYSVADPRRDEACAAFGQYGVQRWTDTACAVSGKAADGSGSYSVADRRHHGPAKHCNEFRIVDWTTAAGAISGAHGSGAAVSDPRPTSTHEGRGKYRLTAFDEPAGTVIAESTTGNGAFALADPRYRDGAMGSHANKMRVVGYDDTIGTVTGSDRVGWGAMSIADPRPVAFRDGKPGFTTGGRYGVRAWDQPSGAIPASAKNNNGSWSVADPRSLDGELDAADELPTAETRLVCRITALDSTWHRPFTTLELAALQSLFDPREQFRLDGASDSRWRERIGNAVPSDAAAAIASTMGRTLLMAWSGTSFMLSNEPIWVRPMAMALAVDTPQVTP